MVRGWEGTHGRADEGREDVCFLMREEGGARPDTSSGSQGGGGVGTMNRQDIATRPCADLPASLPWSDDLTNPSQWIAVHG